MTIAIDPYPWFALGSSVALLVIFSRHLRDTIHERKQDRLPREVSGLHILVAVVFVVVALGLIMSSIATFTHVTILITSGLGFVRGALLVCGIAILLVGRRH